MTPNQKALLLVQNNAYPADFRVRREAEALRDAGYLVSVIAPRGAGQPLQEQVDGIDVYRFAAPAGGRGLWSYLWEFSYCTLAMGALSVRVAWRHGVDVVHAANPPDTLFLIGAAFKLFGRKFIFDQHDLSPELYQSRFGQPRVNAVHRALCLLERLSYATADVVIVTNESYRKVAMDRGGKHPDDVVIVRNGPPASYQPVAPDPALLARAKHLIGYIGTIGPQDGLDYLMRAMACLVHGRGRRDTLAVVIGDGDSLADIRALVQRLDLEAHVLFTGRLSEAESRRWLSGVTVCVQPDPISPLNDKSTMNKVMEYMALGKPVVAFDLVETRVSAGDAALYVQPNDEQEFAAAIDVLLADPVRCRRMSDAGADRVAHSLGWKFSVPPLLAAYRRALGTSPSASTDTRIGPAEPPIPAEVPSQPQMSTRP